MMHPRRHSKTTPWRFQAKEVINVGRVSLYDPERHLPQAEKYARDGLIEVEIAKRFGIGITTLTEWKKRHPAFRAALKQGKEEIDYRVEDSLLKRALGYEYEEIEEIISVNGDVIKTKRTKKAVLPDVTAQIFWLKNRQKEKWRDTTHQEHTGTDGGPIQLAAIANLTPEQRRKRIAELTAKKDKP